MKFIALILASLLLLTPAFANDNPGTDNNSVLSAEQTEALIERAMTESAAEDDDCADQELLSCIGINRTNCESFRADIISVCTMPMAREILGSNGEVSDNLELEHAKCTLSLGERDYEIKPKRYFGCMPDGTYEKPDVIANWLKNR